MPKCFAKARRARAPGSDGDKEGGRRFSRNGLSWVGPGVTHRKARLQRGAVLTRSAMWRCRCRHKKVLCSAQEPTGERCGCPRASSRRSRPQPARRCWQLRPRPARLSWPAANVRELVRRQRLAISAPRDGLGIRLRVFQQQPVPESRHLHRPKVGVDARVRSQEDAPSQKGLSLKFARSRMSGRSRCPPTPARPPDIETARGPLTSVTAHATAASREAAAFAPRE